MVKNFGKNSKVWGENSRYLIGSWRLIISIFQLIEPFEDNVQQKQEKDISQKVSFSCTYNQRGFLHSECVISNGLVYGAEDAQ
jgi:hypothetical protein